MLEPCWREWGEMQSASVFLLLKVMLGAGVKWRLLERLLMGSL